ncbi:unnamed protein product [Strongylus vulgaris]|uniref:Uncharacterized protein n=1 Tax=Strongylus vulgaris TaxID=40348 RepID=A0A3P7M022_STRVU|nr:unnamed protein product [Strongylus vulgaris]
MSMELAHHDMGGYLDPRSFGGGTLGFDDYNTSSSLYDVNTSFGDDITNDQKELFNNDAVPFSQVYISRYDQTRNVPTYPVKTADPSTCTQYAPVRTLISSSIKSNGSSSSRRTSSRSAQKKEAIDPKRVEDEVAR